jgi:pimeloyl-ACP methyl ester carboxylesterase
MNNIRTTALAASLVAAVSLAGAGCSTWRGFAGPHAGQIRERPEIPVGEATAKLHLARPSGGQPPRMLLIHVTGDDGWRGLDPLYFDAMAARGYALAGMSARALRADLGSQGVGATPARLAADYLALIDAAEARLRLPPGTPIVLTGISRGAGLAVVAAAQPEVSRRIAGLLLMGLTAGEGNVRPRAAPFTLLARIGHPIVLLQSTADRHMPAAEARRLFGPDTPGRKLVAIEADNHTFGGHRDELFKQAEAGLDWIARQ